MVEREINAMSQPSGRDLYIARLVGDRGPEDDEEDGQEDRERESDDSTQDSDRIENLPSSRSGQLIAQRLDAITQIA
jgi:hypothetical protein